MPKLVYFLKANAITIDPLSATVIPYVYAERVHRERGRLRADNAQAPTAEWRDGELHLVSRRLPDRTFCGFAYRMPAPDWFVFRGLEEPA